MNDAPDLLEALGVRGGIICAVGAGGKKSLLYALARRLPGRLALTATVHTAAFPDDLAHHVVIDTGQALAGRVEATRDGQPVCYACPSDKAGRHAGVAPGVIRTIHRRGGFDATLVKADGARMRWIKAPKPGEPVLVAETDTVLAVVSARAIGEPLTDRVAHRVDRVAGAAAIAPGERLAPDAVARLLASERGAMCGVGDAYVVPVINMVDDAERESLARRAAESALALTDRFDRVMLCCLKRPSAPVVGVVRR